MGKELMRISRAGVHLDWLNMFWLEKYMETDNFVM